MTSDPAVLSKDIQALKFIQTRARPPSARRAARERQIRRATSGRNR